MNGKSVLMLGDINVDLVVRLGDRQSGVDALAGSEPKLFGGGTVANTAVGVSRLGVPARLAGSIGADSYGRWAISDLKREGVDVSAVREVPDEFTVMVFAIVDAEGERTIVVWPPEGGAHTVITREDLGESVLDGVGWFHTSGMCFRNDPVRETILTLMGEARARGIPVSVDLNLRLELWGWKHGVRDVVERAIAQADVVFAAGEEELMPLTGCSKVADAASAVRERPFAGAGARAGAGPQRVVVARQGTAGTLLAERAGQVLVPTFEATVRDTVGAGDAFNAGFISARMNGLSTREAVERGNAAGAYSVSGEGARHLPDKSELDSWSK